jgi:hypothetical protein
MAASVNAAVKMVRRMVSFSDAYGSRFRTGFNRNSPSSALSSCLILKSRRSVEVPSDSWVKVILSFGSGTRTLFCGGVARRRQNQEATVFI